MTKLLLLLSFVLLARGAGAQGNWALARTMPFECRAIGTDYTNEVYVAGSFSGTISLPTWVGTTQQLTSVGTTDLIFAKFTQSGLLIWARQMGGPGALAQANGLSPMQGLYLVGDFTGTLTTGTVGGPLAGSPIYRCMLVVKFDANGNVLWNRQVNSYDGNCTARGVLDTGNPWRVLVAGTLGGTNAYAGGQQIPVGNSAQACLLRLDPDNGQLVSYAPIHSDGPSYGEALSLDFNGNVCFMARFTQNLMLYDKPLYTKLPSVLLALFDRDHNLVWAAAAARGLAATAGTTEVDGSVNGWSMEVGFSPAFSAIYVAGSYTGHVRLGYQELSGSSIPHAFVMSFGYNGILRWAQDLGAASSGPHYAVYSFVYDDWLSQHLLTVAYASTIFTSSGRPLYRVRLTGLEALTGAPVWSANVGGNGSSWPVGLTRRSTQWPRGNYLVIGSFNNTLAAGRATLLASAAADNFLLSYSFDPPVAQVAASPLSAYPNPAHDLVTLQAPADAGPIRRVVAVDAYGRPSQPLPLSSWTPEATEVSVRGLRPGRYVLRAETPSGPISQTVLVE